MPGTAHHCYLPAVSLFDRWTQYARIGYVSSCILHHHSKQKQTNMKAVKTTMTNEQRYTLPFHMVEAFKEALSQFDKQGFRYDRYNASSEPDGTYHITINATHQEIFALALKVGFLLR
jgi:hypothetical protein